MWSIKHEYYKLRANDRYKKTIPVRTSLKSIILRAYSHQAKRRRNWKKIKEQTKRSRVKPTKVKEIFAFSFAFARFWIDLKNFEFPQKKDILWIWVTDETDDFIIFVKLCLIWDRFQGWYTDIEHNTMMKFFFPDFGNRSITLRARNTGEPLFTRTAG